MLITQSFMDEFKRQIYSGNYWAHLGPSTKIRTASSLLPIYEKLEAARLHGVNIEWDPIIKNLVKALSVEKQVQYAAAIKYLEKSLKGEQSKIFSTLRKPYGGGSLSEKLSKSQQRYTTDLVDGDTGHGLCLQLALLWLQEQLRIPEASAETKFPRLASGNVVGSMAARQVTQQAQQILSNIPLVNHAKSLGLTLRPLGNASFETFHLTYRDHPKVRAFLIKFWDGQHAVAIVRELMFCQFYDANAGSYRIQTHNIQAFLREYNDVCLPKKWAKYHYDLPSTLQFSGLDSVSR
jgi:hypothetical protein